MPVICLLSYVGLILDDVGQSYTSLVAMDSLVSMVTMLNYLISVFAPSNKQNLLYHGCCPWQQVFLVSMVMMGTGLRSDWAVSCQLLPFLICFMIP